MQNTWDAPQDLAEWINATIIARIFRDLLRRDRHLALRWKTSYKYKICVIKNSESKQQLELEVLLLSTNFL